MGGNYMGKSLVGIVDIFNILQIEKDEMVVYLDLIKLIDAARAEQIKKSKPTTQTAPST